MKPRRRGGAEVAYGRRRPWESKAREVLYRLLKRLFEVLHERRRHYDEIRFEPAVRDSSTLADLAARVGWYLAGVQVPVTVGLRAGETAVLPEKAPYMDPTLVQADLLVPGPPAGRRPEIVLHEVGLRGLGAALRSPRRVRLAVPRLHFYAEEGYVDLRHDHVTSSLPSSEESFRRLEEVAGRRSSIVIGTGPSASLVGDASGFQHRIVCNSAVKDVEFLKRVQPTVIAFTDPVFHFGPSRYAAAFRADLLRTAREYPDALLAVTRHWSDVLLAHHPELTERVVVADPTPRPDWPWPRDGLMDTRQTGNVLTNLMLPLAFALSDEIAIAGCDGRNPAENYFWKHNASTQYSDLMNDVFEAHPSFFRDRDYADYYEQHCRELEELIATGEAAGRAISAATPSFIPALQKRGAVPPEG